MNVDTDADLLERLRQGDEGAFSELVQRYHPRLIRLASSFLSRRDLAEDVAQETWLAVLRGIERFEGRCALRTWLFQICVNRARSIAIRERRVVEFLEHEVDLVARSRGRTRSTTPPCSP